MTNAPVEADLPFTWPPSPEEVDDAVDGLREVLAEIEERDTDYPARYALVLMAVTFATVAGLPAGFAIDPAEPAWPVVYIELPTGQVSWHMPAHPTPFDGHTTPEKYDRIKAYLDGPA